MYLCTGPELGERRRPACTKPLADLRTAVQQQQRQQVCQSMDDDAVGAGLLYYRYGRCCCFTAVIRWWQVCTEGAAESYEVV